MRAISARQVYQRTTMSRRRAAGLACSLADADVNAATGGFFADTLRTIPSSYLRPTHAGFLAFFRDCAPRAAARDRRRDVRRRASVLLDRRYRESLAAQRAGAGGCLMAIEPKAAMREARSRRAENTGRRRPRRRSTSWNSWPTRRRADADRNLGRARPLDPRNLPDPAPSGAPRLSRAHQGRPLPAVAEALRARPHAPAGQPAGGERAAR